MTLEELKQKMDGANYVYDDLLATTAYVALTLAARCSSRARPVWVRPRWPR